MGLTENSVILLGLCIIAIIGALAIYANWIRPQKVYCREDGMLKIRTVPCIQCGVCCMLGLCYLGKRDEERGGCKYLKFHEDGHAMCQLYDKYKDTHMFNSGCIIRSDVNLYSAAIELVTSVTGREVKGRVSNDSQTLSAKQIPQAARETRA